MGQMQLVREGQQTTENKLQSLIIGSMAYGLSKEKQQENYKLFLEELKKKPVVYEDISAEELFDRNI